MPFLPPNQQRQRTEGKFKNATRGTENTDERKQLLNPA